MPFLWIGISSLAGILTGVLYEKETGTKTVAEVAQTNNTKDPSFSWYDKFLMAAAGVGAYYIYKKVR